MTATFSIDAENLRAVLSELRKIDPDLKKELQKEMRTELKRPANFFGDNIPTTAPLSGMSASRGAQPPWLWTKVGNRIVTPVGKRAKKPGFYPVVSLRYRSGRKSAGFEITELARSGRSARGDAFVANLNARYPVQGGLGRFVIPAFRDSGDDVTKVAVQILEKFMTKVNRRLK